MCTITARARDLPSRSSASTRCMSLRMRPVMVTRAIDPAGDPVHASVPGARKAAPAATTAQMATMTAEMRQKVSLRRIRRRSTMVSASSDMAYSPRRLACGLVVLLGWLFRCPPERGAEDVAERCPRIGRAVLGNRFLFLCYFERLDRDLYLVGAAVELGDAGIDFLSDRETLRPLLAAVARQLGTLDESGEVGADNLHVDAALFHLGDLAGDDRAFLEIADGLHAVVCELLDSKRDPLLLDIDVEHLGLDLVAVLALLDHLLARPLPVEVGEMHHAVHVAIEAQEQPELGLVLDFAFDHGAGRIFLDKGLPRIAHRLLETERDTPLDRIDLEDLHVHLLRGGY